MRTPPLIGLLVALLSAGTIFAQPTISPSEQGISIRLATPGGEVAVLGAARYLADGIGLLWSDATSLPADLEGATSWSGPWPKPKLAVWVAVDVEKGRAASASTGLPLERPGLEVDSRNWQDRSVLRLPPGSYRALLVRAKTGALAGGTISVFDGRSSWAELDVAQLTPVGPAREAITSARVGDVIVLLEVDRLRLAIFTLTVADLGEVAP